jgi:hypothetical protein
MIVSMYRYAKLVIRTSYDKTYIHYNNRNLEQRRL